MRWHSTRMVNGLADLCRYIPPNSEGAEIGCFAGESTVIFLDEGNVARIHCVDPWNPLYYKGGQIPVAEACFDAIATDYPDRVVKHKAASKAVLAQWIKEGRKLDFIYIDGNHAYGEVKQDIILALKLLKPNGILCGHDYKFRGSPGVERAVKELLAFPDVRFPDYSWIKFRDRVRT